MSKKFWIFTLLPATLMVMVAIAAYITRADSSKEQVAPVDFIARASFYEDLAKKQDPRAMYELAALYNLGRGVDLDNHAAAKLLKSSAALGYSKALLTLARMYEVGLNGDFSEIIEKNSELSERYYKEGVSALAAEAEGGEYSAMAQLARCFDRGVCDVKEDPIKASNYYRDYVLKLIESAENGNSSAQFELSEVYGNGRANLLKDENQQLFWLKKAAEQDNVDALYGLSTFNEDQKEKSIKYLKRAAELGSSYAMAKLAYLYDSKEDVSIAIDYYLKTYRQQQYDGYAGFIAAEYRDIGDYSKALQWYSKEVSKNSNAYRIRAAFSQMYNIFELQAEADTADIDGGWDKVRSSDAYRSFYNQVKEFVSLCGSPSPNKSEVACKIKADLDKIHSPLGPQT